VGKNEITQEKSFPTESANLITAKPHSKRREIFLCVSVKLKQVGC